MVFDFEIEQAIKQYIQDKIVNTWPIYTGNYFTIEELPENLILITAENIEEKDITKVGLWAVDVNISVMTKFETTEYVNQIKNIREVIYNSDLISNLNNIAQSQTYSFKIYSFNGFKIRNIYNENGKASVINLHFTISNV